MSGNPPLKTKFIFGEFKPVCQTCPVLPKYSDLLHEFAASLGKALDARDSSTKEHSNQVADISSILSKSLKLKNEQIEVIHMAGHLHDIGKIGISDEILFKKGPLTSKEWETIKKHPETGAEIVSGIKGFLEKNSIKDIILHHHERFDGKGYPFGLKDYDIPIGARIIALADSVSAMAQNRPYRKKSDFDSIVSEVFKNSSSQFDPMVVNAFTKNLEIIENYLMR
ncbi:MAG: HD-GYP domain-containing protein [Thermodesulfobacteriota bacterium]